jgi:hypothetical protein
MDEDSSDSVTTTKDADARIAALKDEATRLSARLNNNGTNTGTPTSKTAIAQKKVIPVPDSLTVFQKAFRKAMKNMKWLCFLKKTYGYHPS